MIKQLKSHLISENKYDSQAFLNVLFFIFVFIVLNLFFILLRFFFFFFLNIKFSSHIYIIGVIHCEAVSFISDESGDEMEQVDMEEIVQSIPDSIENSDGEQLSDDSEMELDMEAVEEINQLISHNKN